MRLGIDIGGTTINLGVVDGGRLVSKSTVPSFKPGASLQETLDYLHSVIDRNIEGIDAVGIGVPSVVDVEKGIVFNTANIPSWTEVHLKENLEQRYGIPVFINNDANCYAIGAAAITGTNPGEIFVAVTLGTGVGIGVINDGRILNGANTGLGELAWLPYNGKPVEYWCGKSFFCDKGIDPTELFRQAEAGDAAAIGLFKEYGRNLGSLLAIVLSAYDPHSIVFGGGLSNSSKYFEAEMLRSVAEFFPFPESLKRLKVTFLPESDAAIIGAAML